MVFLWLVLIAALLLAPRTLRADDDQNPCRQVPALASQMAEILGVPMAPIQCQILSAELYAKRAALVSRGVQDKQVLRYQGKLFKLLGFIAEHYEYEKCSIDEAGDQSYAFYDRLRGRLVFREGTTTAPSVVAHELAHLLRDRQFNLAARVLQKRTIDEELALSAVTEGDAVLAEEGLPAAARNSSSTNSCIPAEPMLSIDMFPYEWGPRFMIEARKRQAEKAAFQTSGLVTADILYPARFFGPEKRVAVQLARSPVPYGYKSVYETSLGEFALRALLKSKLGMEHGVLGAKGWAADRVELLEGSGKLSARWIIQMDTEEHAQRLYGSLISYLFRWLRVELNGRSSQISFETSERAVQIRRAGLTVTLIATMGDLSRPMRVVHNQARPARGDRRE